MSAEKLTSADKAELEHLTGFESNNLHRHYDKIDDLFYQVEAVCSLTKAHYLNTQNGKINFEHVSCALGAILAIFKKIKKKNRVSAEAGAHPDRADDLTLVDAAAQLGIEATKAFDGLLFDDRPIKIGEFLASIDLILLAVEQFKSVNYKNYVKSV